MMFPLYKQRVLRKRNWETEVQKAIKYSKNGEDQNGFEKLFIPDYDIGMFEYISFILLYGE